MAPHMATGAPRKGFLSRLLPASGCDQFFDLLEQHAERTGAAAALLAEMLEKEVDLEQQAERVKAVEHEGDDMHRLISRMDDVLDLIEASSERIWLYELRRIEPEARAFAEVLVKSVKAVSNAVR